MQCTRAASQEPEGWAAADGTFDAVVCCVSVQYLQQPERVFAEIQRVLAGYFPDVPAAVFAAAIDRYRGLGLYGPDPVTRQEGFDRLKAAMMSGGALRRDVPFEECVDNSLAEAVVHAGG